MTFNQYDLRCRGLVQFTLSTAAERKRGRKQTAWKGWRERGRELEVTVRGMERVGVVMSTALKRTTRDTELNVMNERCSRTD